MKEYTCAICHHAVRQHLKGEENNAACPCCRWAEPWEARGKLPSDSDENPFLTLDDPPVVVWKNAEALGSPEHETPAPDLKQRTKDTPERMHTQ